MSQHRSRFTERIAAWFRTRPAASALPTSFPFQVGDRVQDIWGNAAVIIEVDPAGEHGLGKVRVRYDDGRESTYATVGHPFSTIEG